MPFRYHQSSNIYSRQLVEEFKTAYTNFQVLQGKIASIISDSDLKKYTDGSSTWYSAYSNVVQTVDGINITLGQHTTQIATDGQTIASHTSKLAEYKSTIDEHTSQLSSVQQDYNTLSGQYSSLNQTVNGISGEVGDFKTEVQNNYATQSWTNGVIDLKATSIKQEIQGYYMTNAYLEYAKGTSSTTAPTSGWSTSSPQWEAGKYIWQRTAKVINGTTTYTNTCCIQGAMGNGISGITNYYLATSASSGVTRETSGWTTTIQTISATNKYLWNYEKTTYTSGSSVSTDPHIIGTFGKDGTNGTNGVGISSITEYYKASNSNTTPPTSGWSTNVDKPTVDNRYLWNYEVVTYTNGHTEPTDKRVIGTYGETGKTGVGVTSIVPEYYLSTSSSTQTGGSWATSPSAYIAGRYYWTRQKITYTEGSPGYSTAVLDTELNEVAGRSKISVQTTAPSNPKAGDVWIDSDDRNIMYKYNGSSWETIRDTFVADLSAIFYKSGTTTTADTIMSTLMTTNAFGAVLQVAEMGLTRGSDGKITGKISADRIQLEGVTSINNYFKIKTDGKMECIGGTLAGWVIDSTAIYNMTNGTQSNSHMVRLYKSSNLADAAVSVQVRNSNNTGWKRVLGLTYEGGLEVTNRDNNNIETKIYDGTASFRRASTTSTPFLVVDSYGLSFQKESSSSAVDQYSEVIYHNDSTPYLGISAPNTNEHLRFFNDGLYVRTTLNMTGHSIINQASDSRLKTNINLIKEDNALSKINALKVKSFDWKENGEHVKAGLIAQDLQEVFPELVSKSNDGYLGINKIGLIEYIILAIQELNKKIEEK